MHAMSRPSSRPSSTTTCEFPPRSGTQRVTKMARLAGLGCWMFALAACEGGGADTDGTTAQTTSDGDASSSDGGASPSTSTPGTGDTGDSTAASTSTAATGDATTGDATTGDATTGDATTGDATTEASTTGDDWTGTSSTSEGSTTGDDWTGTSSTSEGSTTGDGTTGACESDDRAVKLARLIDPLDGSVIAPAIVIVHGDRVIAVETDEAKIPCGAEIVDWSAYTGVPGLVDAHTHFVYQTDDAPGTFPWSRSWWLFQNQPEVLAALARQAAEKTVKLGITTAIDKGAGPGDKIVKALRELVGPRIYTAGYGISGPPPSIAVMKGWINQNVKDGADLIKATSGEDLVLPHGSLDQVMSPHSRPSRQLSGSGDYRMAVDGGQIASI